MKLVLQSADWECEGMQRKNRQRNVYPPPNDGREWILLDEAAGLYGIKPRSMAGLMQRLNFTRTCRRGVKTWLVKKEVMEYLDFLKKREKWYKRHRWNNREMEIGWCNGESDEAMRGFLWTTAQAAAFMGVSRHTIHTWGKRGIIPVFVNRKPGEGGRNYYSPTSLRNLKEDEAYQERRRTYEKQKETLLRGLPARELYARKHKPFRYRNIPPGWLTVREVAERLDISMGCVRHLRKMERFVAQQFVGKWDAKRRPWFIHEKSVEELKNDPEYQRMRRRGKKAAEAMVGTQIYFGLDDSPERKPVAPQTKQFEVTFGYRHEELRLPLERTIPPEEMW